jgi:menaquinone-dependent protoporphyrinogen oxidase
MRVLVTWGSKMGGTEGIAREIAETLAAHGHVVTARSADHALGPEHFDAVVIGGALYANRWHRAARHYASRHIDGLRRVPVWLFSSGPLDDSAPITPAVNQVAAVADRIGAREHITFGGKLAPDAKGFPAAAMAKTLAGDWRDLPRVRSWAAAIANALPTARPGMVVEPPGRSLLRWYEHAVAGWATCAVAMALLLCVLSPRTAILVHAVLVPVVFAIVASNYFGMRGAREPLPTALGFAGVFAALDLVLVAWLVKPDFALVSSIGGFWLPLVSIFAVTWLVGSIRAMVPPRRAATTA